MYENCPVYLGTLVLLFYKKFVTNSSLLYSAIGIKPRTKNSVQRVNHRTLTYTINMSEQKTTSSSQKRANTGPEAVCSSVSEFWGNGCQKIHKHNDMYRCAVCGLTYDSDLKRFESVETSVSELPCACEELTEEMTWHFNEFFGYECPAPYFSCKKCGRHYKFPDYAAVKEQGSEAAKRHVCNIRKLSKKFEPSARIAGIIRQIDDIVKNVPLEKRGKLLRPIQVAVIRASNPKTKGRSFRPITGENVPQNNPENTGGMTISWRTD